MTATTASDLPNLIDSNALAELLGVGPRHVRRLVNERRIPFIRWGRYIRFDPDAVSAWLEESQVAPRKARRGHP